MWLGTIAAFLFCSVLLPVEVRQRPPVDPAVKKDGWWIRLNTESKAESITWIFSEPEKKEKEPVTLTWQRSIDPNNFDLPESVRLVDSLHFSVTAKPPTTPAAFCVFHAAQGVMLVEFSGSEKKTLNSRAREKGCTP